MHYHASIEQRCRPGHQGGFTLIEVCVAMAIALLLIGAATLGITSVNQQHEMRRIAANIETTARKSLQCAITRHQNVFVHLSTKGLMAPVLQEDDEPTIVEFSGTLEVCRYGEKSFRAPRKGEAWGFTADGLCEPLKLRVSNPRGVLEMAFDPLTACARRQSIIIHP